DAQADDLDVALLELGQQAGHVAELGGAHRREVLRMREQHAPAIADPLVEAHGTLRGHGGENGGLAADTEGYHVNSLMNILTLEDRYKGSCTIFNCSPRWP